MPKLKTHIEVSALLRRAQGAGAFAAILRKGDEIAGAYMVITRTRRESYIYTAGRNMQAERVWWVKGPFNQADLDSYINRCIDVDPDVWLVEIDDPQGRHFLIEAVEGQTPKDDISKADKAALAAIKAVFPDR